MQTSVVIVLACLVAVAVAHTQYVAYPADDAVVVPDESLNLDTPVHENSPRSKRFVLLKKKLLLGALGLKAVKTAGVAAGVAGALALKKKASVAHTHHVAHPHSNHYGYSSHGPAWNVEVHSWH